MKNRILSLSIPILFAVVTFAMLFIRIPTTALNIIVCTLSLYAIGFLASSVFERKMNFIKNPRTVVLALVMTILSVVQLVRHAFTPYESFNVAGKFGAWLLSGDIVIMVASGVILTLLVFLFIYRLNRTISTDVKSTYQELPEVKKELDNFVKLGVLKKEEAQSRLREANKRTEFIAFIDGTDKMLKLSYYSVALTVSMLGVIQSIFGFKGITNNFSEVLVGTLFGSLGIIAILAIGTIILFVKASKNNFIR